jgi:pimeloyl-ACP methyl ester carboxylesterase
LPAPCDGPCIPQRAASPLLPTIDIPTLVLHGEADARSPLANAAALHAAIATSQLVVPPKLGHACGSVPKATGQRCVDERRRSVRVGGQEGDASRTIWA